MSYIPPPKRHIKDPDRPSPVPDNRNLIIYSEDSISKWFLMGSNGMEDEIPSSAKLVPLPSNSLQCIKGEKPSILMNINDHKESEDEEEENKAKEASDLKTPPSFSWLPLMSLKSPSISLGLL